MRVRLMNSENGQEVAGLRVLSGNQTILPEPATAASRRFDQLAENVAQERAVERDAY